MYKPKLGCRRIAENGGHDGRGLMRCCDNSRSRWSPPVDAGAGVPHLVVHRHRPVCWVVQRSRRRTNPHFHRRTRPEGDRPNKFITIHSL